MPVDIESMGAFGAGLRSGGGGWCPVCQCRTEFEFEADQHIIHHVAHEEWTNDLVSQSLTLAAVCRALMSYDCSLHGKTKLNTLKSPTARGLNIRSPAHPLGLPPIVREGYPFIDDPSDPCWSLMSANWPGMTAEEAKSIVTKTRSSKGSSE